LLVILIVTALFFITLDLRGVSLTKSSRSISQTILAPVQKTVSTVFSPVGRFFSDVANFGNTQSEIAQLKAENSALKSTLVTNSDTKAALTQLKGVLDLAGRGQYRVVAARVIGRGTASSFSQTITIDVGSANGIRNNMTVTSAHGLVGLIKSVTRSSSIVLLMSDPTFKVGVKVTRSQSVGVLSGEGNDSYTLVLLDPAGIIRVGDSLVTNGSENNRPFVAGVPTGQVTSVVNSTSSLTQTATVKAYTNLNDLGVVAVVLGAPLIAPTVPIVPTPIPTITVLVTPTPSPSITGTASPAPVATNTMKK
jgi:rod shape-determining protein MreC